MSIQSDMWWRKVARESIMIGPIGHAMTAERIERLIRPPVMFLDCGEGDEIAVDINFSAEKSQAAVRRFQRSRAARKGWRTRKRMKENRG